MNRVLSAFPASWRAGDPVTRGYAFGALGVLMFAMTLPMTRLAVGPVEAPALPVAFVTFGRAAVAGALSVVYLLWTRAPWPERQHVVAMAVCAFGTVIGFPLFLALALREVESMHAAVVTGLLPLATAVVACLAFGQRPSRGFWLCAAAGCALVVAYAAHAGGGRFSAADGWLLAAIVSTACGYVAGAKLSMAWDAKRTICWVLALSLPLTVPMAIANPPDHAVGAMPWVAFTYVALFSAWIGFFAWYRGLALGGSVRVSQVQLAQPFLSMLFAAPLLGEPLRADAMLFLLAVMATVFVGKRQPVGMPSPS